MKTIPFFYKIRNLNIQENVRLNSYSKYSDETGEQKLIEEFNSLMSK